MESTACQVTETGCQANSPECEIVHVGCSSDERIKHLQKAAKHLQAAGLETEAQHVLAAAHTLCNELLEQKIADLQRLQAEVHALERTTSELQTSTKQR